MRPVWKEFLLLVILCKLLSTTAYSETVKAGVLFYAPPFSIATAQGVYFGFEVDLLKAVLEAKGLEPIFIGGSLKKTFARLQEGEVDLVIASTPLIQELEHRYAVSLPYKKSFGLLVARQNFNKAELADLKNIRFGTWDTPLFRYFVIDKFGQQAKIKFYDDIASLFEALKQKEIDVIMIQNSAATFWIHNFSKTSEVKAIGQPFALGYGYVMLAPCKNEKLIKAINEGLLIIEGNGLYLKIYEQYFGGDSQGFIIDGSSRL